MVYFIGGNGKILTNEMSEAEPSAFSPATDAYRRSKVAEAQAQVEEWKRSHPTSAPTATRTPAKTPMKRDVVPPSTRAAHDSLKARGMSVERLRNLFPDIYGLDCRSMECRQYASVGGSVRIKR
jgi:hypothetical protein